jgi:hypothetical protein
MTASSRGVSVSHGEYGTAGTSATVIERGHARVANVGGTGHLPAGLCAESRVNALSALVLLACGNGRSTGVTR